MSPMCQDKLTPPSTQLPASHHINTRQLDAAHKHEGPVSYVNAVVETYRVLLLSSGSRNSGIVGITVLTLLAGVIAVLYHKAAFVVRKDLLLFSIAS